MSKKVKNSAAKTAPAKKPEKPKASAARTDKGRKVDQLLEELKADGYTGIYSGEEIQDNFDHRLKSDLLGVNAITRGGAVYNGILEIVGPPSSFKTTMALGYVKQAQLEHGPNTVILWLTREGMLDMTWARHNGVKIPYSQKELDSLKDAGVPADKIKEMQAEMQKYGRFILLAGKTVEKDLDAAGKLIDSGMVTAFVFDSIGAISAAAEMEASYEDAQVAVNARLVSKFTKKLLATCNELTANGNETAFILLNQVRAIIGGPPRRGNPTEKPGGFGLKHNKHICLETSIVGFQRNTKNNSVWAKEVAVKVDKSKVCVPHRSCLISFVVSADNPLGLPVGPNVYAEAASMAADCGVFQYRSGKWWYHDELLEVINMETGELKSAKKEELMYYLYQNPARLKEIQDEVLHYHRSLEITGVPAGHFGPSEEQDNQAAQDASSE